MTAELNGADAEGWPLRAEHLTRHFKIGSALSRRTLHAVDDVNFTIGEREIVALAGESGSGKSTIARVLARIYPPTAGEVYFEGKPLSVDDLAGRAAALQRPGADGVPGPVRLDQPGVPGPATACCAASSCTARRCPRRSGSRKRPGSSRSSG